jgi:hypothetical protein
VLAINIVSLVRAPGNEAWLAAYKTMQTVFPEVRAFMGSEDYGGLANVLLFASDGSLADGGPGPAVPGGRAFSAPGRGDGAARRARPFAAADIRTMLSRELVPAAGELARARLLSDDYAPMESLLARTAALWRRSLQASIPDVMLY